MTKRRDRMGYLMGKWKRYTEIGVLVLIMALVVNIGKEQELYSPPVPNRESTQEAQTGQNRQIQKLQAEPDPQAQQASWTMQDIQFGGDSAEQISGTGLQQGDRQGEIPDDRDDLYVKCLQNLHQGNCITYADGYYYFRSQAENYSLCRTEGPGMEVEVVADQVPGAIYVRGDQVYFINVSDNRTLYVVGTDGSDLRKLSDVPMQELVVVGDRVYFRSVYDREYDPFYQLVEEEAEDDRYLYSMKLDGSDCRLLIPRVCQKFTTDGESLYYLVYDPVHDATLHYVLYRSKLDGTDEKEIFWRENVWELLPYGGCLYWVDPGEGQLMRLDRLGGQKTVASGVWCFTISEGQVYVINAEEIRRISLTTGEDRILVRKEDVPGQAKEDGEGWNYHDYNRGIFLVNGQLFAKYFESEEKGVLWHVWDEKENKFVIFEDMEPLAANRLVIDSSDDQYSDFYCPGRTDDGTQRYLDADREFFHEESYGTSEDGITYGNFRITLPRFHANLASHTQLNQQMENLMELALEDRDTFFQEIGEMEEPQSCTAWYRTHGYSNCFIDENYVSMYYYRGGYDGGIREWRQSIPLVFDRETGGLLHMDDLFTVERKFYMKRLTGAIYKYYEMEGNGNYFWNEPFDNNILTKKLGDLRCYLTPDGIVLCYERYEIVAGVGGNPTFEIPYEWFEDIFRR